MMANLLLRVMTITDETLRACHSLRLTQGGSRKKNEIGCPSMKMGGGGL